MSVFPALCLEPKVASELQSYYLQQKNLEGLNATFFQTSDYVVAHHYLLTIKLGIVPDHFIRTSSFFEKEIQS
jgi:hypothetical protein